MRSLALTLTAISCLLATPPAAAQCPTTFTETFTGRLE